MPPDAAFVAASSDYPATHRLDALRASDFARLDAAGIAHLHYTGSGLHATRQVADHVAWLAGGVFGNPHSANAPSPASTALVERTRRDVLEWFGAPAEGYTAIFTANASAALKLVGEAYPFSPDRRYLLTADNHNSVNALREFATGRGAVVDYAPLTCRTSGSISRTSEGSCTRDSPARAACSPFPRSRTSPARSTRLNWRGRRSHLAGTSCSTRPRLRGRTA